MTLDVFDGARLVMTARVAGLGPYDVLAPPGECWLRLKVGPDEVASERVRFGPGSWPLDFVRPAVPPAPAPVAAR